MQNSYNQNPLSIANFFIKKSNFTATSLQLIKLSYIAHGYTLALTDKKLFDETIEAWKHGPVIPSIYHTFKHYGKNKVAEVSYEYDFDDNLEFGPTEPKIDIEKNDLAHQILDAVWEGYSRYNGFELVDLTHQDGTPWSTSYQPGVLHKTIEAETIKDYYKDVLTK